MKRLNVFYLTVVFFAVSVTVALAGPSGWGHGPGSSYRMGAYAVSNLNLTQEQQAKLQTLDKKRIEEMTPLQRQAFTLRSEMHLLWNEAKPDQEKITAKQKEIFGLQRQLQEKANQYRMDYRNVLTSEQWAQLAANGSGMRHGYRSSGKHGRRW